MADLLNINADYLHQQLRNTLTYCEKRLKERAEELLAEISEAAKLVDLKIPEVKDLTALYVKDFIATCTHVGEPGRPITLQNIGVTVNNGYLGERGCGSNNLSIAQHYQDDGPRLKNGHRYKIIVMLQDLGMDEEKNTK